MIAYLDMASGISGDMMLGCLVGCGWPADRLRETIERLDLPHGHWAIEISEVQKCSLRATQVVVLAEEQQTHRRLRDVTAIIDGSDLPREVRDRATAVFNRLAAAEAKVHGTPIQEVHFHEVGAIDAMIDIVGAVAGLADLGIERLFASAVPLGSGWIDSAHGRLPLPAPATLELLAAAKVPTVPAPGPVELVTPTGAALVAELATFHQPFIAVTRIGTGAGRKDFAWPNVARLWLGEPQDDGPLVQLETNVDDMNPQLYADVCERLFAAGAKDVWLTTVQMKKARPGVVLSVLARSADESLLADLILRQTTTLGVRVHTLRHRHEVRRELREVTTPFGTVRVKLKWIGNEPVGAMPEFDDCRARAQSSGATVRMVHDAASAAAQALLARLRENFSTGAADQK